MFNIEKNVPLKVVGHGARAVYPFAQMEVGDSFSAPLEMRNKLSSATSAHSKKSGRKFAIRLDGDGVRVWRVA